MKHPFVYCLLTVILTLSVANTSNAAENLHEKAAKMLMVGFKGDSITPDNPVISYLKDTKVGGIILFDIDLTGSRKLGSRNITSRQQLKHLTHQIDSIAGYPVLIAVDQEGGKVQRLKPRYGFSRLPSAKQVGALNNADSTIAIADIMAREMAEAGINVNLAPELDIHRDNCPVIGELDRAYSSDPAEIIFHAGLTIDKLHQYKINAAVKHFPGHGSATSDSHYGLTDVTNTWSEDELKPFSELIGKGKVDMVMTAHIFNRRLDPDYPATMSKKILTDLLRDKLGFDGVILTDDMYMQGIIDNYSIEEAVIRAINAGADMLIMGNNITTGFEADRPAKIVALIVKAVEDGRISRERINDANRRIDALRNKFQK